MQRARQRVWVVRIQAGLGQEAELQRMAELRRRLNEIKQEVAWLLGEQGLSALKVKQGRLTL